MWKFLTLARSGLTGIVMTAEVPAVDSDQIIGVLSGLTDQFSVSNIIALIAGIIGFCVVFVFLWWGVRKGFKAAMSAIKSGKFKF